MRGRKRGGVSDSEMAGFVVELMIFRWLGGFAIALIGALAAVHVGAPLPWMLGALIFTAATRISGVPTACPRPMRYGGQWVIGTSLGLYFTPQVAMHIGAHWGVVLFAVSMAIGLGVAGAFWIARFGGVDFKTAWFSAAIGGASEMSNTAEQRGARLDRVATAHSLRVLIVVCTVPFVFNAWGVAGSDPTQPGPRYFDPAGFALLVVSTLVAVALFKRFRLPSPWVLGSLAMALALTINGIELSALPQSVVVGGQLLIGWSLGDKYRPDFFLAAPRFLSVVAVFTVAALVLSALFAWGVSHAVDIPLPVLILGMTPGGIAEMSLTAKALQLGTPIVTAFQVTRMVAVVLVTGPFYDLLARRFPHTLGTSEKPDELG